MLVSTGSVRPSTEEDVLALRFELREADQIELASYNVKPEEALRNGLNCSHPNAWTILCGDTPCAMFGVVPVSGSEFAAVWLLGSDGILEIKRQFLRECKGWLEELGKDYSLLFNDVHHDNVLHIKWLKWLGFTFMNYDPPFIEFARIPCVNQ